MNTGMFDTLKEELHGIINHLDKASLDGKLNKLRAEIIKAMNFIDETKSILAEFKNISELNNLFSKVEQTVQYAEIKVNYLHKISSVTLTKHTDKNVSKANKE